MFCSVTIASSARMYGHFPGTVKVNLCQNLWSLKQYCYEEMLQHPSFRETRPRRQHTGPICS